MAKLGERLHGQSPSMRVLLREAALPLLTDLTQGLAKIVEDWNDSEVLDKLLRLQELDPESQAWTPPVSAEELVALASELQAVVHRLDRWKKPKGSSESLRAGPMVVGVAKLALRTSLVPLLLLAHFALPRTGSPSGVHKPKPPASKTRRPKRRVQPRRRSVPHRPSSPNPEA